MKAGVLHVEPPFAVLAGMVTLRAHLDDCGLENGPLWVAPGSHRRRVPAAEAAALTVRLGPAPCLARAGDPLGDRDPLLHASTPPPAPVRPCR